MNEPYSQVEVKEEPEEVIETPKQPEEEEAAINSDELEHRTRSISKSPSKGRDELDDSKSVQTSFTESATKDKPEANKSAVKSPAAALATIQQSSEQISRAPPTESPVSPPKKKVKFPGLPNHMPEELTAKGNPKRKRESVDMEVAWAMVSETKRLRIESDVEGFKSEAVQLPQVSNNSRNNREDLSGTELNYANSEASGICSICENDLGTRRLLKGHMKQVHEGMSKCSLCDNSRFFDEIQLNRHRATVHLFQSICNECGAAFKKPKKLRQHMTQKHTGGSV